MSRFTTFRQFYPYYLSEHTNRMCRRLHFVGSCGVLIVIVAVILGASPWWLLLAPVIGYGFAWVGHYGFEKNHPATFRHPLYSLMGDWMLFWQMLSGQRRF
ncbi:MAG TPA: DUF962 domain-containing protein [Oleiagrimonas sp.]|nr:DUF962 domain-containing protein [Oleiagrimonas sp.]